MKEQKNNASRDAEREELDVNSLNKVTGAGDPFQDIPRVPEEPIDDQDRKDI